MNDNDLVLIMMTQVIDVRIDETLNVFMFFERHFVVGCRHICGRLRNTTQHIYIMIIMSKHKLYDLHTHNIDIHRNQHQITYTANQPKQYETDVSQSLLHIQSFHCVSHCTQSNPISPSHLVFLLILHRGQIFEYTFATCPNYSNINTQLSIESRRTERMREIFS